MTLYALYSDRVGKLAVARNWPKESEIPHQISATEIEAIVDRLVFAKGDAQKYGERFGASRWAELAEPILRCRRFQPTGG